MRLFTIFLTLCIIALSVGGTSHVSSMKSSEGSSVEASFVDKYSGNSVNLDENHCGPVCTNLTCHAGLCHILTKSTSIGITALDLNSSQIISSFRKPKNPYLEGDDKPPKIS